MVRVEREGKRYVYIYISLNTALVIPVDAVKKGNLDEFAAQAEKMIERLG
ncbi:MAG: YcxB family protein [Gammaproteobacteria bacterium]